MYGPSTANKITIEKIQLLNKKGNEKPGLPVMEWIGHRGERYSAGNRVNDFVAALYGDYPCCKHSIIYRVLQSLRCTPKTNVTLCINFSSVKKKDNW